MAKLEFPLALSRVRVSSPCNQNWNTMQGNDRVRFCDHCAQYVHNLSEMTPDAALELVERSEGRLCVRYIPNPDGSPRIAEPAEPWSGGTRLPMPRLAAGILSAALTLGVGAPVTPAQSATPEIQKNDRKSLPTGTGSLTVTVTDVTGAVITGATVTVKHTKTGWSGSIQTDDLGRAIFRELAPGFYIARVSANAFRPSPPLAYEVGPVNPVSAICALDVAIMGEVICISSPTQDWLNKDQEREQLYAAFEKGNPAADFDVFPGHELFEAIERGKNAEIQKLLAAGLNLDAQNYFGDTPLIKAVEQNGSRLLQRASAQNGGVKEEELVKLLIDGGANVNLSNRFGVTPLMYAAVRDTGLVRQFIRAGANPNAADDNGRTPLMFAAFEGKLDVVKLLVQAGADVNARDAKGQSVLGYALAGRSPEKNSADNFKRAITLLKKAGAVE